LRLVLPWAVKLESQTQTFLVVFLKTIEATEDRAPPWPLWLMLCASPR
jgi:hypothetical protein